MPNLEGRNGRRFLVGKRASQTSDLRGRWEGTGGIAKKGRNEEGKEERPNLTRVFEEKESGDAIERWPRTGLDEEETSRETRLYPAHSIRRSAEEGEKLRTYGDGDGRRGR